MMQYLVKDMEAYGFHMDDVFQGENLYGKDGAVIGGLYAAGEVVGGVMGDDSPSGANNGWAVTSGKLAAESIAAALETAEDVAA